METFRQNELQISTADDLEKYISYIPHYALSKCLLIMDKLFGEHTLCLLKNAHTGQQKCKKGEIFAWGESGILDTLIQMATTGIVCYVLLFLMESRIVRDLIYCKRNSKEKPPPANAEDDGAIDDDVNKEKERVAEMTSDDFNMHDLVLKDLTKFHGDFLAINQISIGIKGFVLFSTSIYHQESKIEN